MFFFLGGYELPWVGDLHLNERLARYGFVLKISQVLWLSVVFVAIRSQFRMWQAFCLGFVACFGVVAPTYYYYIMMVVPYLFFCGQRDRRVAAVGICGAFGISLLGHSLRSTLGMGLPMFFWFSLAVMMYCLLMLIVTVRLDNRVGSSIWEKLGIRRSSEADHGEGVPRPN